ncbi:MAG TPA: Fe-S cluster assembly sulfur transfer protein SufU [Candidatus Azoamicus sp.]
MIDLYKDLIIDHGLNPRNKYIIKNYTHTAKGFNHFCGDSFTVYIDIINNNIINISFEGKGCSISTASASIMTISSKNKSLLYFEKTFDYLKNLLNNKDINEEYTNINILSNIKKFPSRIKCATLIWHTMQDAIKNGKINILTTDGK